MSDLLKLAERCEAATGPDRELDAAVARCFCNDVESDDGDFWWGPYNDTPERVPDFTASIDAAMTLVPEGLSVALYIHPDESHCDVYRIHPSKGRVGEAEQAKSPALALCAAALRARSAAAAVGGR